MSSDSKDVHHYVLQLINPEQRDAALIELIKFRETCPDLAPVLWHSYGTVAALIQEIVSVYPMLSPPTLNTPCSNRVCNALALLQCVASHTDTKNKLMTAQIPLYLYPFLNTVSRHRPFEYLRLTSLGVIGALVKVDDSDIINFLLQTEIIPLCLRIMETGSELSKTVATFIIQKILLDEAGLTYVCATAERFYAVSFVLSSMVSKLQDNSVRLLKHIVRCYLRLSEHTRAREALRQCLPESLRDQTFAAVVRNEESAQRWLALLIKNLNEPTSEGSAANSASSSNSAGIAASSVSPIPSSNSNNNSGSYTSTGPIGRVPQSSATPQQSSVNVSPISTASAGAFGYNANSSMPTSWNGNS